MTSNHAQIIADAVERTRELIETKALATAFCDEWFTAPCLRRVYETVWNLPRGRTARRGASPGSESTLVHDDRVGR